MIESFDALVSVIRTIRLLKAYLPNFYKPQSVKFNGVINNVLHAPKRHRISAAELKYVPENIKQPSIHISGEAGKESAKIETPVCYGDQQ